MQRNGKIIGAINVVQASFAVSWMATTYSSATAGRPDDCSRQLLSRLLSGVVIALWCTSMPRLAHITTFCLQMTTNVGPALVVKEAKATAITRATATAQPRAGLTFAKVRHSGNVRRPCCIWRPAE